MLTSATGEQYPRPLTFRASSLASFAVATAMLACTIVFSEPAVADALLMVLIVAVPMLGAARFGKAALFNYALLFAMVGLGLAGTPLSTTFSTALPHQLITLFLSTTAFVIAGYVAVDPEPRAKLILVCYVIACLIATAAAFIGYFRIIPSLYEVFTNYDRARGTFKDPNVYSAALAPAIVATAWVLLRERGTRALIAGGAAIVLVAGLLISFSRGAWISTALSLAIMGAIALSKSRRRSDFHRFAAVGIAGMMTLMLGLGVATQFDQVRDLLEQRANLDQSYDEGPDGRFGGQQKARALILANPFGIGTHTFRDTYHHEEPHNVYLSMFLNAGWLGGIFYIVAVLTTLVIGIRTALRPGILQGPATIAAASFAGLVMEGYIIDSDHWRHFFIVAGLIWGLADAAPPLIDAQRRRRGD
jgi:O-antigen ligase